MQSSRNIFDQFSLRSPEKNIMGPNAHLSGAYNATYCERLKTLHSGPKA